MRWIQKLRHGTVDDGVDCAFVISECESLIRKMLVVDANKRFSLWQVKRHRWMQAEAPAESAESAEEQDLATTETANEQILRLMQSLGVDPAKTKESLDHERYDHHAAIYYLLLERRSHLTQATATGHSNEAPGARRPAANNEIPTAALDHAVTYSQYYFNIFSSFEFLIKSAEFGLKSELFSHKSILVQTLFRFLFCCAIRVNIFLNIRSL